MEKSFDESANLILWIKGEFLFIWLPYDIFKGLKTSFQLGLGFILGLKNRLAALNAR